MGGAKAGECASRLAVDTVVEILRSAAPRDSKRLLTARRRGQPAGTRKRRHNDPTLEGMGTTLVAALEIEEDFSIAKRRR
jgi:serine/threonine protein phosphatase PrpC